jgi:hypothetical protein
LTSSLAFSKVKEKKENVLSMNHSSFYFRACVAMAGGVFVDQPFHANPKCIAFSLVLMLAYWYLPKRNPFLLPLIFVVAYVAMAWYDHLYDCDMKMYGGKYGGILSAPWKPQRRKDPSPGKKLLKDQEGKYRQKVNLFHVLVMGPLLLYIGWRGRESNPLVFAPLLGVGVTGPESPARQEYLKSVYIMHAVAIMPLLIYVGLRGRQADVRVFPILLAMGVLSDLYHSHRLVA